MATFGRAPAYAAGRGGRKPRAAGPPRILDARLESTLTDMFNAYGDSGVGWTGADSTYSVRLRDGRVVWIFSDTFLGPVKPDGTRPKSAPFLNNTFVIQQGTTLETRHGGSTEEPEALLPPESDGALYWAGDGMLGAGGTTLDIVYHQFVRTGDGQWDLAWNKDVLARFDVSSLELVDRTDLPSGTGVTSGAWLLRNGEHTYNYRVEDRGENKHLHIARVAGADLRGEWEYFTGTGWSATASDTVRGLTGVANEYSVTRVGDWYLLLTQDTTEPWSPHLVAYFATSPTGPFEHRTPVYTTPETGESGSYGDPNIYCYNAHVHPHLSTERRLIVSYNVNSLAPDDLYDDVSIYRPRFIEVLLGPAGSR